MWIVRDFEDTLFRSPSLPIKILKGPRQVGKTSLLCRKLSSHELISLDDGIARIQAQENPRLFLDNRPKKLILDEGPLAPELFPELKRRVDEARRRGERDEVDIWITGSNQTLLQKNVRESLAGRASYFDLKTLSLHELQGMVDLPTYLFRGGWPELYVTPELQPVRYLNDLISTFIEKDIVAAAGIERKNAFTKCMQLTAARIGQLFNFSDIATNIGVDTTTVQSWLVLLETNGVLLRLPAYATNLNNRLIKSPKFYFDDPSLATRFQGWSSVDPLLLSPMFGPLLENIAVAEIVRSFVNRGENFEVFYLRSKEKVEVDLLIALPNQRWIAAEVKSTPKDFTPEQLKLLDSVKLNVVARWVLAPTPAHNFQNAEVVTIGQIWEALNQVM